MRHVKRSGPFLGKTFRARILRLSIVGLSAAALIVQLTGLARSQDKFVPIPQASAPAYHFDFMHNFFLSPANEKTERGQLNAMLENMETFKGKVASSSRNLLLVMQLYDKTLVEFMRHYTYLYLRYAVNTLDETSRAESSEIDAAFNTRTAFLREELTRLDSTVLDKFMQSEPELTQYSYAIRSMSRVRPHTLPLDAEEAINSVSQITSGWQYDLYVTLRERISFGTIATDNGQLDVLRDRRVIAGDTSRSVREKGFNTLYAGYAGQRDLHAFALLKLAEAGNRLARLHHFDDSPSETYFDRYWTKTEVSNLLIGIRQSANVHKRYERMRADYVGKMLGYHDVNIWDMSASFPGESLPRFSIQKAREVISEALSPLGQEYGDELRQLLDPVNGRMDIVPGKNRKSGGFSKGFPGVTTVFFSGGFKGYYDDVRVLTHEAGHAIHRQLMKNNHVLPVYANGPSYLFESFSIFNEFLLADYLYQHETEASKRRYLLEQFFEGKGMMIFIAAQEAMLEQAIYEGVQHGTIQSADDLDSLAKTIGAGYSIWPEKHDELKMSWISNSLYYEDPLYDINYVYGSLLALTYYNVYARDPKGFVPRYIALMKNGFTVPPEELLKHFLGIDLSSQDLVTDAVRLIEKRLDVLEDEYKR